jgi:chromosome segregation ATPase
MGNPMPDPVEPIPAQPAPQTLQTAEQLDTVLNPFRTLIMWQDNMKAQGGLEQAANEAQSRAQAAQRDLEAAQAQLDATNAAQADQVKAAQASIADATQKAKDVIDAANVQAATIISEATATAQAASEQAATDLAALNDQQAFAAKTLKDTNDKVAAAQAQYDAIQTGMLALKAQLG